MDLMIRFLFTLALLLLFIFPAHAGEQREMDRREIALAQEELRLGGNRRVWVIRGTIAEQSNKVIRQLEVWTPLNCVQEIVQELEVDYER